MSRLDAERRPNWAGQAVMALTVLALVLVAIVPLALLAGVVMMVLGHVTGGFALFGGSVLAAIAAVILAARTGLRHLRREISRSGFRIGPLDGGRDAAGAGTPRWRRPPTAAIPTSSSWTTATTPRSADLTWAPALPWAESLAAGRMAVLRSRPWTTSGPGGSGSPTGPGDRRAGRGSPGPWPRPGACTRRTCAGTAPATGPVRTRSSSSPPTWPRSSTRW